MVQLYFMLKDISERNTSCLLPELSWSYNNTYCNLSSKHTKSRRFFNTNQHWKIWNRYMTWGSHSSAIFWDVVITQRWNVAFQKTLILRDNMHSKCSMYGKNSNIYRIMVWKLQGNRQFWSYLVGVEHNTSTFILQDRYLYSMAWFMKNILFEQKKIKSWNKQHFVENRTEIMQHVLKCSKFPSCLYI